MFREKQSQGGDDGGHEGTPAELLEGRGGQRKGRAEPYSVRLWETGMTWGKVTHFLPPSPPSQQIDFCHGHLFFGAAHHPPHPMCTPNSLFREFAQS